MTFVNLNKLIAECLNTMAKYKFSDVESSNSMQYHITQFQVILQFNKMQSKMSEQQEQKSFLKLYIETNKTFIEEKIYNQFNIECLEEQKVSKLSVKKLGKVIREIFSMGEIKVSKKFDQKIDSNIKNFVYEEYKTVTTDSFHTIDIEKLISILMYCIDQGFDIEEEIIQQEEAKIKEKPKEQFVKKSIIFKEIPTIREEENIIAKTKKDQYECVKPKISTYLDKDKIPEKKQFQIEKFVMPEKNVPPRYLIISNKYQRQEKFNQTQIFETIQPLNTNFIEKNRKTMIERLEKIYEHYCFQQHNIGFHPTFDKIRDQSQKMSIGKFLLFCKNTSLFSFVGNNMEKDALISTFKKVAEGKLLINFQEFQVILCELDKKMKQNGFMQIGQLPSYEARLRLDDQEKYRKFIKPICFVFRTKQKQGREIRLRSNLQPFKNRQLTAHSGKFSQDLSINLKDNTTRTIERHQVSLEKMKKGKQLNTIQLDDLKHMKSNKMEWLIQDGDEFEPEQTKKGKEIVTNLRRRVDQVERLEKRSQGMKGR